MPELKPVETGPLPPQTTGVASLVIEAGTIRGENRCSPLEAHEFSRGRMSRDSGLAAGPPTMAPFESNLDPCHVKVITNSLSFPVESGPPLGTDFTHGEEVTPHVATTTLFPPNCASFSVLS